MGDRKRSAKHGDTSLTVVHVPKAAEIISSRLRVRIIRSELKQGAALPSEADLMVQFGVSRPTLREAMRILESEGLVSINRGAKGGAVVRRPSLAIATRYFGQWLQIERTTIGEIYRANAFLEAPAARLVAERGDPEAIEDLQACLDEARAHLENDVLFGTDTARFRNTLLQHSGLPTLGMFASILNNILESSRSSLTVAAGSQVANRRARINSIKSIETLMAFLAVGDGAGAEEYWREYTTKAEATMRKWVDTTQIIDILGD